MQWGERRGKNSGSATEDSGRGIPIDELRMNTLKKFMAMNSFKLNASRNSKRDTNC